MNMKGIPFVLSPYYIQYQLTIIQRLCEAEEICFTWEHKFRICVSKEKKKAHIAVNYLDNEFYVLDRQGEARQIFYSADQLKNWILDKLKT